MSYLSGAVILPSPKNPWSGGNAPGGLTSQQLNPVPFLKPKPKPAAPKPPVLKPNPVRPPNPLLDAFKPVKPVNPVLLPALPAPAPAPVNNLPVTATIPLGPIPVAPTLGPGPSDSSNYSSGGGGGSPSQATLIPTGGGLDALKDLPPIVWVLAAVVGLYTLSRKRG